MKMDNRTDEFFALLDEARNELGLPSLVKAGKSRRIRHKNRELETVSRGIAEMENLLRQVESAYIEPWPDDFPCNEMQDAERDMLEERFASFFLDMRAVAKRWEKSTNQSFEIDIRNMLLHRVHLLATSFRELQRLRSRREALRQELRVWKKLENDPWKQKNEALKKTTTHSTSHDKSSHPVFKEKNIHIFEEKEVQQQQQMQMERESETLLAEIQAGEYDYAQRIESRMQQVSDLLATFSSLTMEQHEPVSGLFETMDEVAHVVEKGRDQLHRAVERKSNSTDFLTLLVVFLTISLLFLHYISP